MGRDLSEIAGALRERIEELHSARERALGDGRKIIQLASKAIKHIHRHENEVADNLLSELATLVKASVQHLSGFAPIKHAPYIQDAIKEYVEAEALRAITRKQPLPEPEELGVEPQAYLNGICEAASECRRYALDEMRSGNGQEAHRLAAVMEDIYDELITFDYPDALMSNLRRNVDALRAVLERTQSDLAVTGTQIELIEELRSARKNK